MGDIADWMVEQALMDELLHSEYDEVEVYLRDTDNRELISDTKVAIEDEGMFINPLLLNKLRSIIIQGIAYQNLTPAQRYALGKFVIYRQ